MRHITFVTRIFKHDYHRFGFYIPVDIVNFYELRAENVIEGLIYRRKFPNDSHEVLTSHAYNYPQRRTIRIIFPDFYNDLSSGDMIEATISADIE